MKPDLSKFRLESYKDISQVLKALNIPGSIFPRGRKLYLKRLLPPKPYEKSKKWRHQEIATGCFNNPSYFKKVILFAIQIDKECAEDKFDWRKYQKRSYESDRTDQLVLNYKNDYLGNNPSVKKLKTWKNGPWQYLSRLLPEEIKKNLAKKLEEEIKEAIEKNEH